MTLHSHPSIAGLVGHLEAMESPQIRALIPAIEGLSEVEREALYLRAIDDLAVVTEKWDRFAALLASERGLSQADVQATAKAIKSARAVLSLSVSDGKIVSAGGDRSAAEAGSSLVAAWLILNRKHIQSLAAPRDDVRDVVDRSVYFEGPTSARRVFADDVHDILDGSGTSRIQ